MKRKSAEINPETSLEVPHQVVSGDAAIAVEAAESSATIVDTTEACVKVEEKSTEPCAVQLRDQSHAETVDLETTEAGEAPTSVGVLPAIGKSIGNAVYGVFYYASYGAVFSALTVARMVPMDNLIGRAIREGAFAASSAQKSLSKEPTDSEETTPDDSIVLNA